MKTATLLLILLSPLSSLAQVAGIHRMPAIQTMVEEVSKDSLESYLEDLVSFGTRHSLSPDQDSRGIEAARKFVLRRFQSLEAASMAGLGMQEN